MNVAAEDAALVLEGELTIYTATATLATLRDYLSDRKVCALNLSAVTEMDSAGLQLLLWARRMAAEQRIRFQLVGVSQAVVSVIDLLQIEPLFGGYPTDLTVENAT
ncbi:hypothetical protein CKO09_09475 [Chromatium weissei]|nr:hypothetical protein [Chromatium weissei]